MCLIINKYQGRFLLSVHFSNVGVGDAVGSGPCFLTGTKKPRSTELSAKMLTVHPIFKAPRGGEIR